MQEGGGPGADDGEGGADDGEAAAAAAADGAGSSGDGGEGGGGEAAAAGAAAAGEGAGEAAAEGDAEASHEASHSHSHEASHETGGHGHSHEAPPPASAAQPPPPPPSSAAFATNEHGWPVYAAAPPRPPGWAPEQRPRPASDERRLSSHKLAEAAVRSMNPPPARDGLPAATQAELSSRLVVALAQGVHSGRIDVDAGGVGALPIVNTMLKSFLPTAQPHHVYRWYFAFDHNDRVFEQARWRDAITAHVLRAVDEEDARRWHPPGYARPRSVDDAGRVLLANAEALAVDNSALVVSVHWVQ